MDRNIKVLVHSTLWTSV